MNRGGEARRRIEKVCEQTHLDQWRAKNVIRDDKFANMNDND